MSQTLRNLQLDSASALRSEPRTRSHCFFVGVRLLIPGQKSDFDSASRSYRVKLKEIINSSNKRYTTVCRVLAVNKVHKSQIDCNWKYLWDQ